MEQVVRQGFNVHLIEGVDGRGADWDADEWSQDRRIIQWQLDRALSGPELGCALGHMKIYQAANELTFDWVAIFEDDARLEPDALANLEVALEHLSIDVPIILTMFCGAPNVVLDASSARPVRGQSGQPLVLARSLTPTPFALAYVMNRPAVELASRRRSIDGVADWPLWAEVCDFWVLSPWLATPDAAGNSLIEASRKHQIGHQNRHSFHATAWRRLRVTVKQITPRGLQIGADYFGGIKALWRFYFRKRLIRVGLAIVKPRLSSNQIKLR